jgi:hypothetical protein
VLIDAAPGLVLFLPLRSLISHPLWKKRLTSVVRMSCSMWKSHVSRAGTVAALHSPATTRRALRAAGQEGVMPRYGPAASRSVERAMHKRKKGTLKSGGSGKTVKSREQAIAIGLSEARQKGAKVPAKRK